MEFILLILFALFSPALSAEEVTVDHYSYGFFPYANYDSTYNTSYGISFEKDSEIFSDETYYFDAGIAKKGQRSLITKYQNSYGDNWIELARIEYSSFYDPYYFQDPSAFIFMKEKNIKVKNLFYYKVTPTFYFGPYAEFHHRHEFNTSNFPNENATAIGGHVLFDNRDSKLNPHEGIKLESTATYIDRHLNKTGVLPSFSQINADLRKYTPINGTVLASRIALGESFGKVNYSYLYRLGGIDLLRGYQENRYIGKEFIALQTEERINLYKEFIMGTVSLEAGNTDLNLFHKTKFNYGAGFRIALPPAWRNILVVNYGVGSDQSNFIMEFRENF